MPFNSDTLNLLNDTLTGASIFWKEMSFRLCKHMQGSEFVDKNAIRQRIFTAYLAANPLCAVCKNKGRQSPATAVRHKINIADGGTNDWDNLAGLCSDCDKGDR